MRPLYKKYGAFEDLSGQEDTAGEESFGFDQVNDKEIFLDGSTVSYSGIPIRYAKGIVKGEDAELLRSLKSRSATPDFPEKTFPLEAVLKTLEKFKDLSNVYVVVSIDWIGHLRKPGFYEHCDVNSSEKPRYVDGFVLFQDSKVPCVLDRPPSRMSRDMCLVVDMKRAGTLRQLYPISTGWEKDTGSPGPKGGFFFDIHALSHSQEIREEILGNPPEWLYLNTKVRIAIQERFDLKFETERKPQPGIYCLSLSSFSQKRSEDG